MYDLDLADFPRIFQALTGHTPLSWQERLFHEHFAKNNIPRQLDLPTGLGKTMVMAIWLIARIVNEAMPRRLVYVVDRRTVVDQATDLARLLRAKVAKAIPTLGGLSVSTLRGQLADNRQWSRDPSRPAIIIGTVDLIGSALLFSGYRSSYKRRPLEAGLLGQDSLLVLDEAHLSRPFEKLLVGEKREDGNCPKGIEQFQSGQRDPLRIIRMSATSSDPTGDTVFRLDTLPSSKTFDLWSEIDESGDERNPIKTRFEAKKRLTITTLGEKDELTDRLASKAIELAKDNSLCGKRIVVFVRKPAGAKAVAKAIRAHVVESVEESGSKPKKVKKTPYNNSVEVLTGTRRGLERDELVEKPAFKQRWLNGDLEPDDPANQSPVFLISTSAGEVGFDLNADHLVGDEAPLDSWIQRLGRVNRRGNGEATVVLVRESKPTDKTDFDKACIATSKLLTDGMDVSPKALAAFRNSLTPEQIKDVLSPTPTTVELTDILLDAWSMTSITEPMPGRPEVGPWLRGIADWEPPQTTIAWRAELDEPGFADLDLGDIEEWFDTHRILTHETLSVLTSDAAKWFTDRWDNLDDGQKSEVGGRPIVIDRSGLGLVTLKEVIQQLARKNTDYIRHADLILPASFGGIERGDGLLDATAPKKPEDAKDVDEQARQANAKVRLVAPDVADLAYRLQRQREIHAKAEDDESVRRIIGGGTIPKKPAHFGIGLISDDDHTIRLVSHVPKREELEYGTEKQPLRQHVDKVCDALKDILPRLSLSNDFKLAAQLAAQYHDHGKNRERWQRLIGGKSTPPDQHWLDTTLGKSGGEMRRDPRGYRHEFGSLREFSDAFQADRLLDDAGNPISSDVFDLGAHLIAAHHGRARPHFPRGGFDPLDESRSDEIHAEAIRRFARLQRKYGRWRLAWLENLLRCADALASADQGAEDDPADSEGDAT